MGRQIEKIGRVYSDQSNAVHAIRGREEFCTKLVTMMDGTRGRRMFARWLPERADEGVPRRYVVYLFGTHYPAFVWDDASQTWYGNKTKWSRTTTKYMSQYAPRDVAHWFYVDEMEAIAYEGIARFVERKVAR